MLKIDQYAYTNRLAGVHPAEKLLLAGVTLIVGLIFPSPVISLLVILIMTCLTIIWAGIPARFFSKLMLLPLSFLVIGVLTVALVVTRDGSSLLWGLQLGGWTAGVTVESLQKAGVLFFKALGAVSCLYFLSLTTPLLEIISVLRMLRCPPLLIELMTLIYRFIFVLLETADKIYISQSSRWGYATWKTSYYSLGQLASSLFGKSYYNSQLLFKGLLSRCYTGSLNVLDKSWILSRRNIGLIILLEVILLIIGFWSQGWATFPFGGVG